MSLRSRLTLFYTAFLGGMLILFGLAVYGVVSFVFVRQVDLNLETTVADMIYVTRVDSRGRLSFETQLSFGSNVMLQAWDVNGHLVKNIQPLDSFFPPVTALDPANLDVTEQTYSDVTKQNVHLRVLSVPIESEFGDHLGIIQAGANVSIIDGAKAQLVSSLVFLSIVAISLSAIAGFVSTRQALEPLRTMTNTALHISRADDLSRRVPIEGSARDEVGQLVTAFNQTLERLEELFNSQRRFVADVGHELRTPLTVIRGNLDLMEKMGSEPDPESIAILQDEVDRLSRLVGDLLLLAQAESGKLPLEGKRIDLDTVVLEVFQQGQILSGGKTNIQLVDFDQVQVCGDRDRIKQVFLNLISNAIKYTPDSGEVKLSLGQRDDWAYFLVQDDGPGIPKEDQPHIFERFFRTEKSRSRSKDGKGFGLGLSIAYWIVRHHEGRIEMSSIEKQGTTFCVWLPVKLEDC